MDFQEGVFCFSALALLGVRGSPSPYLGLLWGNLGKLLTFVNKPPITPAASPTTSEMVISGQW